MEERGLEILLKSQKNSSLGFVIDINHFRTARSLYVPPYLTLECPNLTTARFISINNTEIQVLNNRAASIAKEKGELFVGEDERNDRLCSDKT